MNKFQKATCLMFMVKFKIFFITLQLIKVRVADFFPL